MKHPIPCPGMPAAAAVSSPVLKMPVAALLAAGLLSTASVWAQQAGEAAAGTASEPAVAEQPAAVADRSTAAAIEPAAGKGQAAVVTVTGVRRSAQSAQAIKRNADGVVDSIVAEDIGKFPDNNVAETLARVTGIQIRRDSGEASAVLIRGLPDVATLLNGRELFTTTGRYVNLADIPATMLQRVDVHKSQSADQAEGGVAGIIDVRTNRPFDFKGFSLNVSARGVYADKSDKTDPQLAATVSNRWKTDIGEFGALLGLSYQRSRYHEERAFNTAPVDKSWLEQGLTAPDQVGLIPITGDRRRSAANGAVQWRPTRGLEIYAEGMLSRDQNDYQLNYFVGLPWWTNTGGTVSATTIAGTNQARTITSTNVNTITSTQANRIDSLTQQYAVGAVWDASDQLRATTELARTTSRFNWTNPILDTVTVVPNVLVDTNRNGTVHMDYTGIDMTDASNFYLKGFFDRYGKDEGKSTDWRGDLAFTPENGGIFREFSVGSRIAERKAESIKSYEGNAEAPDVATGTWPYTRQNASTIPGLSCTSASMASGGPDYGLTQWYTPCASLLLNDLATIRQAVTGTTAARALDPGSYFGDQERTYAIYGKAKVAFDAGPVPVDGTFGVRVVKTQQTLQGYSSQDGTYTLVESRNDSTDVLPSMSWKAGFRDDLIGRFTAGRTISRPGFSQLNPGVALVRSSETVKATGSGGNPNLKPVTGDNFDAALEYYFNPTSSVTGTLFHHKFDGYLQNRTASETFDGVAYDVTRPYNTGKGHLQGFEVGYQQFYDWLPGWLGGFGLQANYTWMRGETTTDGITRNITGLSKSSYNIVALYERGPWYGRLAYNWRSKFVDSYDQGGAGLDLIVAPTKQMDASVSYKINDRTTLTLDAVNLLDTEFKDYWNTPSVYPRDTRRYDRTIGLALRWKY